MSLAAVVAMQDVGTALCGLLNAGYFAGYWWRPGPRSRRIGAGALSITSAAAVVEALFSQGLFWSQREALWFDQVSSGMWVLTRLPLFVATVLIAIIVMRRLLS